MPDKNDPGGMRVGFLAKKGIDSADNIDSPTAVLIDDKKVGIVVKAVIKRNEESFDTFFREFGVFSDNKC